MDSGSKLKPKQGDSPSKSQDGKERTPTKGEPPEVRLTFGIELEFFYEYDEAYQDELNKLGAGLGIHLAPDENFQLVYEVIAKILSDNQIPVNPVRSNWCFASYEKWSVMPETLDSTFFNEPNVRKVEIEVTSRILVLEEKSFEEVRLVLDLLENFPGPYKFYVNRFTGFHVHVAAQKERFVLPWLKKFTQTVTAFEHEIESLHSDDRIRNRFALAPSQVPMLLPRGGPVTSLAVLDQQSSFADLQTAFVKSRYTAYNFDHLFDPESYPTNIVMGKQTIEFRQHAGTLDADTICNWVEFVCALIRYSFRADHRDNLTFLMNHLENFPETRYTIEDLMRKIGVPHLFPWYRDNDKIRDRARVRIEDLPENDQSIELPDVQPLWDLLQHTESGINIGIGVRGMKRQREEDEDGEELEPPHGKKRRRFDRASSGGE
ncbi:hypothetical protein MMC11_001663 [Xylographa trunciseda]|nr:hypothetical protein [Xylographa trunciseda]